MELLAAILGSMTVSIVVGAMLTPIVLAAPLLLIGVLVFVWRKGLGWLWAFSLGAFAMMLYVSVLAVFSLSPLTEYILGMVVMMVAMLPVFPLAFLAERTADMVSIPKENAVFLIPVLFGVLSTFVAFVARQARGTPISGDV